MKIYVVYRLHESNFIGQNPPPLYATTDQDAAYYYIRQQPPEDIKSLTVECMPLNQPSRYKEIPKSEILKLIRSLQEKLL